MSTEVLTLGEAARFAGVSQTTLRTWIHKVEDAKKLDSGGYSIPKNSLMQFLAMRGKGGSERSGGSGRTSQKEAPEKLRIEARLQAEVEYLRSELREARGELKEAQSEIRRLEAELRAILSGGGISGTLSRWIRGR